MALYLLKLKIDQLNNFYNDYWNKEEKIMRKTYFALFTMIMISIFTLSIVGSAAAFPISSFSSIGWVDPNYNNSWNPTTYTGTARYYISWSNPDVNVTQLSLMFEGDIFNLSTIDANDFKVIAPSEWTTQIQNEGSNIKWSLSFGNGIDNSTSPIIVQVQYELLSSSRYYYGNSTAAGDSSDWGWLEAQGANIPWAQKYTLYGTGSGTYISGGSTAPVPEPASLFLLGSGFLALGLFGRRRMVRNEKMKNRLIG
jgi:hypothetical protein